MAVDSRVIREVVGRACALKDVLDACERRVDRPGKSGGRYVCELPLILPDSSAL
jgi:hypothetical protein